MSLDTKHRPHQYGGVLGQGATKSVLKGFVSSGKGYHQSYIFAGLYGSGKTTLGRILARALLCDDPVDGEPCDKCRSCRSLLERGVSDAFVEVDAATNSGKESIKRILESLQYATMSGKRRVYLFDEAHQLSRDALDALLKPLEDEAVGSEDKRLVCIFCTTEPEKMRETVFSRCAPIFHIKPPTPSELGAHLGRICEIEGLEFDPEMLEFIAEAKECHVRDALKAVEGVSMLGAIDKDNVETYLGLDLNTVYLDVLEALQSDQDKLVSSVQHLLQRTSPLLCYQKLSELALTCYMVSIKALNPPAFLDPSRLARLAEQHGTFLLTVSQNLSERPARPSAAMLICDVLILHQGFKAIPTREVAAPRPAPSTSPSPTPKPVREEAPKETPSPDPPPPETDKKKSPSPPRELGEEVDDVRDPHKPGKIPGVPVLLNGGVYRDNRLVRRLDRTSEAKKSRRLEMEPAEFCRILRMSIAEMDVAGLKRGSTGRTNLDSH